MAKRLKRLALSSAQFDAQVTPDALFMPFTALEELEVSLVLSEHVHMPALCGCLCMYKEGACERAYPRAWLTEVSESLHSLQHS